MRSCLNPLLRLVCFPRAGGAAGFFRSWVDLIPEGVELIAVRYPGRADPDLRRAGHDHG
ncbi:thioesterase domain-containing protein [Streptomyces sp. MUM 2J]|uniref:thioesterase domain-containing protein n=1 Tax=unclassified Streptomyces TaxID=2593676 RepID=UPI0035ABBA61|nr:hypothetical protein [Streptomyces sp. MUM 2J]MCH0572685.1 hypothetical protein [Streptomyces sp. MUM 136J]